MFLPTLMQNHFVVALVNSYFNVLIIYVLFLVRVVVDMARLAYITQHTHSGSFAFHLETSTLKAIKTMFSAFSVRVLSERT